MRHRIEQLTNWFPHPKGRHRRTLPRPGAAVNAPQAPRRIRITVNGDTAATMPHPYVVVAEPRRNGAVAW